MDFEIEKIISIESKINQILVDDFDHDGIQELLFYKYNTQELVMTDFDFNNQFTIHIEFDLAGASFHAGVIHAIGNSRKIFVQLGKSFCTLSLIKVPVYANLLLFIGIYIGVFGVVFISQKFQKINARRREKVKAEISELQLKSTLNQLDPHFAFNVINSISNSIIQDRKEEANDFLVKFSRLLRTSLEYSEQISWPFQMEIQFVNDYLKIQKSRYGDLFEYEIENELVEELEIPKMLIYNYVENSIKHGLRPKGEHGIVRVAVENTRKAIKIRIEDNGIGIPAALKNKSTQGTGKGTKLNMDLIQLYNQLAGVKITVEIQNLVDPSGTIVVISIPS
jgi:hypothetical protein